jgi:hypothetical protein
MAEWKPEDWDKFSKGLDAGGGAPSTVTEGGGSQWKPEDWDKFSKGLPTDAGGADPSPPKTLLGATEATVEGMGKGIANFSGNLPRLIGLPALHSKWASSTNKDYPIADTIGRYAPEGAALAALPEMGVGRAVTGLVPELANVPKIANIIGKAGEGYWKGEVGGAAEGDSKVGGITGAGSAATAATISSLPHMLQYGLGLLALESAREMAGGGHNVLPWGSYHFAYPLSALAAMIMGKAPGVSGAIGAKYLGDGDARGYSVTPGDKNGSQ